MRSLQFDTALLPDGWAEGVVVSIDPRGNIVGVDSGAELSSAEHVPGCVLPGIPNLHCHAHQRAMAGLAERSGSDEDSFWTWRESMFHYVARMQPHHLEAVAAQLYVEMLKAGYTSVAEFQYLHHDPLGRPYAQSAEMSLRTLAAAEGAGIGITSLPVLYRFGGFGARAPAEAQRRFVNDAEAYLTIVQAIESASEQNGNAAVGLAPHSLRAVSGELLEAVLGPDRPPGPVHIHIAEQEREVAECLQWSSLRPVEWLLEHATVDRDWCLIHATHISEAEMVRIVASGAVVGLCPTTEANLGDGLFDAEAFQRLGGRFGIGSDSNVSVSLVEELRWLEYGQRLLHRRRNVLAGGAGRSTGRAMLEHVLSAGGQACGRPIARIAPGARADFIVLDSAHPSFHGRSRDDLLDSWVFSGSARRVRDVYVGGRCVIADGSHPQEREIEMRFRRALDELSV
jgi:formimidoylglutamate deiminase